MRESILTILVIDDEKPIRDEIRSLRWHSIRAAIIDEASDGRTGLEKCRRLNPDIVLADIEMPVMDGLTFAEQAKQFNPDIQIIFLTCHQNFFYAQRGIKIGALGYVLKSLCMEEDLFPLIEKASLKLERARELALRKKDKIRESIKKLTYDILSGKDEHEAELTSALSLPCHIRLLTHTQKNVAGYVSAMLLSYLNNKPGITAIYFSQARYIVLSSPDAVDPHFISVEELLSIIEDTSLLQQYDINFYLSEAVSITCIPDYLKLIQKFDRLDYSYFYYGASTIDLSGLPDKSVFHKSCLSQLSGYIDGLTKGSDTAELIRQTSFDNHVPPYELKSLFISNLIKALPDKDTGSTDYTRELFFSETFDCILNLYTRFLNTKSCMNRMRPDIADAVRFIEENYMNSITLADAADIASLSPDYLGKLFKNELGQSFTHYLNKVRVAKAIELLQTTNKKVYEVAQCVGIDSYRYFLVIFQKISGKTPKDYQRK